MEEQGEIAVAQGPPLPPFEHWSFGEERYIQFLQDQVVLFSVCAITLGSEHTQTCSVRLGTVWLIGQVKGHLPMILKCHFLHVMDHVISRTDI